MCCISLAYHLLFCFAEQRFVEITAVFQGFHGLDELKANKVSNLMAEMQKSPDQMYICNYRLVRILTYSVY
jgi:hypothetical protein